MDRNTGHDWIGRNTGGGALQVWVHRFEAFEYLPSVKIAQYEGQAARVGVALEQHEVYNNMGKNNIKLLAPGSPTVGAYGGFMQGGGFSYVTTKYGLMADQVLALEVVTARSGFTFQTGPVFGNSTSTVRVADNETFWKGMNIYFSHNLRITTPKHHVELCKYASSKSRPTRAHIPPTEPDHKARRIRRGDESLSRTAHQGPK